jgi:molybdopterin synthase sulfur carrier subunit
MALTVVFIGALRHISGKTQLKVECNKPCSLKEIVYKISQETPKLKASLIEEQSGEAKTNALILVNGREISVLSGLETQLSDGDEIVFVPVVHGG